MIDKDSLQHSLQGYVDKALLAERVTDTAQEILKELRKTLPDLIAEDIVGVQPIGNVPMTTGEYYTGSHAYYWVSPAYDADLSWEDRVVRNRTLNEWCTLTYGPGAYGIHQIVVGSIVIANIFSTMKQIAQCLY